MVGDSCRWMSKLPQPHSLPRCQQHTLPLCEFRAIQPSTGCNVPFWSFRPHQSNVFSQQTLPLSTSAECTIEFLIYLVPPLRHTLPLHHHDTPAPGSPCQLPASVLDNEGHRSIPHPTTNRLSKRLCSHSPPLRFRDASFRVSDPVGKTSIM